MPRPDIAEHLPIKPLWLVLGVIACIGIAGTLFTLLFGFMTIPANSVGVRTRFGAYHDIVNPNNSVNNVIAIPTQAITPRSSRNGLIGRCSARSGLGIRRILIQKLSLRASQFNK